MRAVARVATSSGPVVSASMATMAARPVLRGVVFDMDGTLTKLNLDFGEMYRRAGVDRSRDILTELATMEPEAAAQANRVIDEMEAEGRRTLQLMDGAAELGKWLQRHGVPVAVVTRNTARTLDHFNSALWTPLGLNPVHPAISRDDAFPPKPDPAALVHIAKIWGAPVPQELVMVGDSAANDVAFGNALGAHTVLLNQDPSKDITTGSGSTSQPDATIRHLLELPRLLWTHFELLGPLGTAVPLLKHPTPEPSSPGCRAAAAGDLVAVQQLASTLEANEPDSSGNPPLIWAADRGHADCVAALLEGGVDVNARGFLGATATARACRNGDTNVLAVLIAHPKINLDLPNDKLQSPLHFAAFKKHTAAVKMMLDSGASAVTLDRKGRTPAEDTSDPDIREIILSARAFS